MLSRYRNFEKLGSGGMGVVYRAEDATLNRLVAIKLLTHEFAGWEQVHSRFLREARVAASLNHPNVCTIYEAGEVAAGEERLFGDGGQVDAGMPFMAMELIEGRTLEQILERRAPLPIEEVLRIAAYIADGLAAAHAKGIVHRDLKPANVMITSDGRIKILDFGLAKPMSPEGDAVMTAAATISDKLTTAGQILGTVAYMSPEQASGQAVDPRSDVFSFGIILYEMVAGHRPFRGPSTTSILAKILESEPEPLEDLRADVPVDLLRIIRRCLRKPADDRYNDTRDLVAELKDLRQETTSGAARMVSGASRPVAAVPDRRRGPFVWALVGVLAITAGLVSAWLVSRPAPVAVKKFRPDFRQVTFTGNAFLPALSPDGKFLAYGVPHAVNDQRVVVQDLAGGQPLEIFRGIRVVALRWSPSGSELLIAGAIDGTIEETPTLTCFIVPRLGGPPRKLGFRPFPLLDWSPDGKRIAGSATPLDRIWLIDVSTGETEALPLGGGFTWLHALAWSPAGGVMAFGTTDETDNATLWTITLDGKPRERIVQEPGLRSPRWAPDGSALYFLATHRETSDLMKVVVDPATGQPRGSPSLVLSGLRTGQFSPAREGGRLVFAQDNSRANLVLWERRGERGPAPLSTGTLLHADPVFSPDGREIAYVATSNLHVMDRASGATRQLTFLDSSVWSPVWSPDGREIAFGHDDPASRVWRVAAAGGGTPRVWERTRLSGQIAWCPGPRLLYQMHGNRMFQVLDPATGEERPLCEEDPHGWMFSPVCSPDGSLVAFTWNRTGADEVGHGVWVVALAGGAPRRIHERWATLLRWSSDGTSIYAVDVEQRLLRIPAGGGPAELLEALPSRDWQSLDLSPDLERIVAAVAESQSDIWLVEHFDSEPQ